MLIGWKTELFKVNQIKYGIFSLSMKIRSNREDFQWWLSCIYGPSVYHYKNDFWIELNNLVNLIEGPWCAGGDFEIL